ncbi:MAG: MFS transporter [Chloroflexota bacterium]
MMPWKYKPPKVFFGWWIVIAAFLISFYVGGSSFYSFTAFISPIVSEMGWNYQQVSLASSLRGMETGLLAPLVGFLIDRWGPRRIIFGGTLIGAWGIILLSRATSLAVFYGAFALMAIGTSCSSLTATIATIGHWFRSKIGIASAIAVCGYGFGGLLTPVITRLIDIYNWRTTLVIIAVGLLVVVLPLSLLFRHKPEQYGYLPDGQTENPTANTAKGPAPTPEARITIGQALKSSTFWRIAVAFLIHVMVLSTTVFHIMPYLESIGVARYRASLVAMAMPLISISGRLGLGWLADRTDRRRVALISFALMGLGMLLFDLAASASIYLLVPFLVFFGTGYGGSNITRATIGRVYFGRSNIGLILGLTVGISRLGGIIGPYLGGWMYDRLGSYQGIWFFFAGLLVIAVISVITLPVPRNLAAPTDTARHQ